MDVGMVVIMILMALVVLRLPGSVLDQLKVLAKKQAEDTRDIVVGLVKKVKDKF